VVLNFKEYYNVYYSTTPAGKLTALKNAKPIKGQPDSVFFKPFDNAGTKAIKDYKKYAAQYQYGVNLPPKAGFSCAKKERKKNFCWTKT